MSNTPVITTEPHQPLVVAIIGLGYGRLVVQSLLSPELKKFFRIGALCDLDPTRAAGLAKDLGIPSLTFEQVLEDPGIPVIGLFTGPKGRAELLQRAIRAGKHVMTTKPFELNSAPALRVFEEAARLGRLIYLNSPSPVLPADLALINAWKEKHDLGRPLSAQLSTWVRYDEKADGSWMDDPALCPVAPIFRLGIYLINDLIEIFGDVEDVHVMASRLNTGRPTVDHAQLAMKFRNGGLATILCSFCIGDGRPYRNSMTLNFEHGTVYRNVGLVGNDTEVNRMGLLAVHDGKPFEEEVRLHSGSGDYPWETFYHAIHVAETPSPEFARKVAAGLRVIEAMAGKGTM